MARLIDLDKALVEAEDECRMSDDWKVSHEMMNVFKYQPTVKAILIEWLKKWEGYEQGMAIVNLKDIVEYWEKENE